MIVPILHHAPIVTSHARNFKKVFANHPEYEHFRNYLTGLIAVERKNFTTIAKTVVNSSDNTNVDRFMNSSLWFGKNLNDRRVEVMDNKTRKYDASKTGFLVIDDTLDEHVGTLFEHISKYYDHSDGSYKLAQNPVTSHYVRGQVSFPVDFRRYRSYDEATNWEIHFRKNFPEVEIPKDSKGRNKLKKKYEKKLLEKDEEFRKKHEEFRTKLKLAVELIEDAIQRSLNFSIVLFDGWYLASEVIEAVKKHGKEWISILKTNRNLEASSLKIYNEEGKRLEFDKPLIKVCDLVPLIPKTAYREVVIDDETVYWAFTFTAVIPTVGKVRLVIAFDNQRCEGHYAVLATGQLLWEAKKIISSYLCRWEIEIFYKDAKQELGFSDYQCRKGPAIEKHWYMVFCAYSLLKLDLLQVPLYKGMQTQLKAIGIALRRQVRIMIEKLILACHKMLCNQANARKVFKLLFGHLAYES